MIVSLLASQMTALMLREDNGGREMGQNNEQDVHFFVLLFSDMNFWTKFAIFSLYLTPSNICLV